MEQKLPPGIWEIGNKCGGWVRAFLVEDGAELTLIDTLYPESARLVKEQIHRLGRPASSLKHIVLTHAHRAHLGGLAELKRWSGATIHAHEWEADIIAGERKPQAVTILPRRPLKAWIPWQVGLALGLGRHPTCPVDEHVADEQQIGSLTALHTPGHTPGHLSLYRDEQRFLIAGDAIATWPRFEAGWPAFTLNEREHRASLCRMAGLDLDFVGVGHGDPITHDASDRVHSLLVR